jgi:hypothetical protein
MKERQMAGSLGRMLGVKKKVHEARMILDMLAHRLRDGGPAMTREQIRERVEQASVRLNDLAPRTILRDDN